VNRKLQVALVYLTFLAATVIFDLQLDLPILIDASLQMLGPDQAALLFVLLFTAGTVVLIPSTLFLVIGGAWFGLAGGLVLNFIGFQLGALLAFLVARHLARDHVKSHIPARFETTQQALHLHGWKLVALLRISGLFPAVLLNHALGVTSIRLRDYVWATAFFSLPVNCALTYMGVAGEEFVRNGELLTLMFALGLMSIAAALAWVLRRRFMQ
jgi:uncharacterized membrane protein YdjX (TVP38/TMEM64 family)